MISRFYMIVQPSVIMQKSKILTLRACLNQVRVTPDLDRTDNANSYTCILFFIMVKLGDFILIICQSFKVC